MKAIFSVLICAVSIQAIAGSSAAEVKFSSSFKFKQDIELAPSRGVQDIVSAGIGFRDGPSVYGDNSDMDKLEVYPGASVDTSDVGCFISKKVDFYNGNVRPPFAKIRSSYNQWSIQLKKHELIQSNLDEITVMSKFQGFQTVIKRYNEEFELKNQDGITLQLNCKRAVCIEEIRPWKKSKANCDSMITHSTGEVLKALGVESKTKIENRLEKTEPARSAPEQVKSVQ